MHPPLKGLEPSRTHARRRLADQEPGGVRPAVDGSHSARVPTQGKPIVNPTAYRIIAPRQVPGVVGVQAFDALSGAAHATGRSMPDMVGGNRCIPFLGVPLMGLGQLDRVAGGLGISNPTDRFESTDA